jgi:hypothetical protein
MDAGMSVHKAFPAGVRAGNGAMEPLAFQLVVVAVSVSALRNRGKTMREFIAPTALFIGAHIAILYVAAQMYALGQ